MATDQQIRSLVDQMPDPDERGMYTENIDKAEIDRAVAALAEGGADSVRGVIAMLDTPGSAQDVKPHYALHCLVNHALVKKDPELRRQTCQALAEALAEDHSDYIKSYLCQELQWAGGPEATAALGKLLLDPELVEPATMALVAIREGAGPQFRQALPRAEGVCRLNVVQGLGAVEDRQSIETLRQAAADPDVEVRLAAGWGLARMGDPGAVDLLIKAADVPKGRERTVATKHCMLLAEKLRASDRNDLATRIYAHLRQTRTDPDETYIRLAATRAMAAA
jgi:HEAT repeat protein